MIQSSSQKIFQVPAGSESINQDQAMISYLTFLHDLEASRRLLSFQKMSMTRFSTDPLSAMMREINRLTAEPLLSSIFDTPASYRSRRDLASGEMVLTPKMDIYDAKDSWKIQIDLPGVPKQNVIAEMRGVSLHVEGQTGELKDYEKFNNLLGERRHGKYSRVITLPPGSDYSKVKAEYKNGVLMFSIPKKSETRSKMISVS